MPFVEQDGLNVVVAGAAGAVGSDLIQTLARSALPVGDLRLLESPTSSRGQAEVEGRTLGIHPLANVSEVEAFADKADLIFICTPAEAAGELLACLEDHEAFVIDLSGILAANAPLWVPALGLVGVDDVAGGRRVVSPSAAAVAASTLIAPLGRLGLHRFEATVMLSAGVAGKKGSEELSQQVISLFNGGEPSRAVFPDGLAFDVVSSDGAISDQGVSATEARVAAEIAATTGFRVDPMGLSVVLVPTMSGVCLSVSTEIDPGVDQAQVEMELDSIPTIRVGQRVPGPRRLVGKSKLHVGRVRHNVDSGQLRLWAAGDNLRFGASGNAVTIATQLWRGGHLG